VKVNLKETFELGENNEGWPRKGIIRGYKDSTLVLGWRRVQTQQEEERVSERTGTNGKT